MMYPPSHRARPLRRLCSNKTWCDLALLLYVGMYACTYVRMDGWMDERMDGYFWLSSYPPIHPSIHLFVFLSFCGYADEFPMLDHASNYY